MKKRIIILVFILLIFSVSCILVFNMTKIKSIKEPTSIKIDQMEEKNNNDNNNCINSCTQNYIINNSEGNSCSSSTSFYMIDSYSFPETCPIGYYKENDSGSNRKYNTICRTSLSNNA